MKDAKIGSIFVLHIQPTIPTYMSGSFTVLNVRIYMLGLLAGYTEQRLILFASSSLPLFPYFFEQWSSLHFFSFHRNGFALTRSWSFFFFCLYGFMYVCMHNAKVHSSMCM